MVPKALTTDNKGSIDVANTFNLINILKTTLVIVAILFLLGAFQ